MVDHRRRTPEPRRPGKGANCATPWAGAALTAYLNGAEVRAFGQGAAEVLVLYAAPEVRLVKKLVSEPSPLT